MKSFQPFQANGNGNQHPHSNQTDNEIVMKFNMPHSSFPSHYFSSLSTPEESRVSKVFKKSPLLNLSTVQSLYEPAVNSIKSQFAHVPQHSVDGLQHHYSTPLDRSNLSAPTPGASTLSPAVFPRSISEACFDSASSKFRQLPCRTFISVGTCPYRERCVYLHDPRCICKEAKTKTRRKNKEDVVLDSLFWPVMPQSMVNEKLDGNGQPHVIQTYSVPAPQDDQYQAHDRAVYSLWMHFVDFCVANQVPKPMGPGAVSACFSAPNNLLNRYTNKRRLPIFLKLSSGPDMQHNLDQYSPTAAYQTSWETPLAVESYGPEDDGDDSMVSPEQAFTFVRRNLFPEEQQPSGSGQCSRGNASPVTVTASFLHSPSSIALTESDMPSKMISKFPSIAAQPAAESDAGAVRWGHWDPLPQPAGPAAAAWNMNMSNDPYYDGAPLFTSHIHIPDGLRGHFPGQNAFGTKLFA